MRVRGEDILVPPINHVQSWVAEYVGTRGVIDASQGTSGAKPPMVPDVICGSIEQYGPRWGRQGLRESIARDLSAEYSSPDLGAAEILVTAGCNEAFCAAARTLIDPGDRVILLSPYYFNHDMWLRLNGIKPLYLDLPSDGQINPDSFLRLAQEAAAIIAVSPANPTGAELSRKSVELIVSLCRERRIPFILDETYAHFRHDTSRPPHEIFDLPDWRDFFVSLRSLSKEFSMPGHRIGAAVAAPRVLDGVSKWHDCMSIVAPTAGQEFAEFALARLMDWREQLAREIRAKGARFVDQLKVRPTGFRVDSWGCFFAWLEHPFPDMSDEEAARRLAASVGVLTVPGSYFAPGDTGRVRLSFAALNGALLDDVVERLSEVSG
jgi:aspartate/methionine/tyrosine aminotransferase